MQTCTIPRNFAPGNTRKHFATPCRLSRQKAWPSQFRHPDDGRKWDSCCWQKAEVWDKWVYIGEMATEAQILGLLKHRYSSPVTKRPWTRRTVRRVMARLKRQGFVKNIHKHGLRGAMEVAFQPLRECGRMPTRKCGRVKIFSSLPSEEKKEKSSRGPRSVDDLKIPVETPSETPTPLIEAKSKPEEKPQNSLNLDDNPQENRIGTLIDRAVEILVKEGHDREFVELAVERIDERAVQTPGSPGFYLFSFRTLLANQDEYNEVFDHLQGRRWLRNKWLGTTKLPTAATPEQEQRWQEWRRRYVA